MKRKIFILFFLWVFLTTGINAAAFDFLFPKITNIPAFSKNTEEEIYCDTIGHWCNYSAEKLYKEGIFTGMKIGDNYYFSPDEYITRGDFLLYLNAILKIPASSREKLPFADLSSIPKWQLTTVQTMYDNKLIRGNIEKGKIFFNYDEKISRLECAIILNNMLGLKSPKETTDYSDNYLIPDYAVSAVKNVSDYKLMQGYEDKSFRPYIKINRAMLADILCKVNDYNKKHHIY